MPPYCTHLQQQFHQAFDNHTHVWEVFVVGSMGAMEFVAYKIKKQSFDAGSKVGPKFPEACLEQKLIARTMLNEDILGFAPPLSITWAEMDDIVQCISAALNSVADQLTKEYLWNGWEPIPG